MSSEILTPVLPESVADGTVIAWNKQVGDAVKMDDVLVEIETDKVVLEVPAMNDGVLTEITQEEVEDVLGRSIPVFSKGIEQLPVSLFELPLRQAREQFEHDYLSYQLEQCAGNVSQLAERVQMERTHLYRKMRSLNIDPKQFSK